MLKIIDGKRYNTETAECLCDISPSGFSCSDFRYEETSLYRTKSGRFFIAGKGNALSRWATRHGQTERGPGSGIRPLDPETARELLEEHGDPADVEKYFDVQDA